jgi:predicted permease
VAVISYSFWQRRFGGEASAVGRTLTLDRVPFTIIGVTPPGFFGVAPGLAPEITIPLTALQDERALRSLTSSWLHLLGRMQDGLTVERANVALQSVWPEILEVTANPGMPADRRAAYMSRPTSVESARAGYSRVRNQFEEPLWVLLTLVGLLLAVASASAANLLLARGTARRREFAVRLAIGAGRWRLIRQMLTEALVWAVLGAVAGLLIASWGTTVLVAMMTTAEARIALEIGPNWRVMVFTLVVAFLTAAICAIVPALRATRLDAGSTLKEFGQIQGGPTRRWSLGKSLVTAQVAVTVLLLFGAGLFVRSLQRILAQEAGFERSGILVVSIDATAADYSEARHTRFYATLLERFRAIPGVESASMSLYPPISDQDGAWTQSIEIDGVPLPRGSAGRVYFNGASEGYFRTLGIRILRGRDFLARDTASATRVVAINESFARRFFGPSTGLRAGPRLPRKLSRQRARHREKLKSSSPKTTSSISASR